MGGRFCNLDQLYKKFSGNEIFSSPKLNEDQKQEKGLRRKLKSFFPEIGWRPKKKVFAANCDHFRQEISRMFKSWLAIFPLVIQRSNLDGRTPKSRWGDAKSRWGGRKLSMGGRVPPRPPYNLGTGYNINWNSTIKISKIWLKILW